MTSLAIAEPAWRTSQLVQGARRRPLTAPTPCGRHDRSATCSTTSRPSDGVFTGAATRTRSHRPAPDGPPSAANLDDSWRTTTAERLMRWPTRGRSPAAWTGTTNAGRLPTTGEIAGAIVLDELVVHGWDLARATSRTTPSTTPTIGLVRAFIEEQVGEGKPIPRSPIFFAAVPTPATPRRWMS